MDEEFIDQDNSLVLKELIEDFVENLNKHRNVFDELCLNPFYAYVSGKLRIYTAFAYGIIVVFLTLNIITLLVACDVRSLIRSRR